MRRLRHRRLGLVDRVIFGLVDRVNPALCIAHEVGKVVRPVRRLHVERLACGGSCGSNDVPPLRFACAAIRSERIRENHSTEM